MVCSLRGETVEIFRFLDRIEARDFLCSHLRAVIALVWINGELGAIDR
jgi:hypothetical protein